MEKRNYMTAAEFAATREALHLPIAFLADRWGITRQSVQRWESGYRSIPKDIAESLRNLLQERDNIVNDQVAFIESHRDTEKVILVPKGSTTPDAVIMKGFPPAFSRSIAFAVSQRTGLPLEYQEDAHYLQSIEYTDKEGRKETITMGEEDHE